MDSDDRIVDDQQSCWCWIGIRELPTDFVTYAQGALTSLVKSPNEDSKQDIFSCHETINDQDV